MATSIPELVERIAAPLHAAVRTAQFLPHAAIGLLAIAIALHALGLDDPSQFVGAGAFFALALAVVLRREPS